MSVRNIFVDNRPLAEARALWMTALKEEDCLRAAATEDVPVDDSLGRITAEAVYAPMSSPFYNAAAMDGIAVRFRETIGASENNPLQLIENRGFVFVNTGNPLPDGFDAVIMIEDIQQLDDGPLLEGSRVEIIAAVPPWQHVRTIGEDIVATELILPTGHLIRPIDLGAMLATGVSSVKVRHRPRVIVLPTGSELVQPGGALRPGNIIEFNSRILCGYLQEWGAEAIRGEIVRDDREALKAAISRAAADFDFVIVNAGASAGTKDFTVDVLRELGNVIVHGVNIKPGKPVILAVIDGTPVIGLPGYPVSAVLTLRLFVRPLVDALLACQSPPIQQLTATLSRPIASRLGVEEFVRVRLGKVDEHLIATPSGRGAGAVMSLVNADGIITVPAEHEGLGAGERVQVELLRRPDEIENTLVFIGSHDNILDVLANLLSRRNSFCRLSSAHVGSMGGILAIGRGEAHIAGTHLLDEESNEYNVSFIKKYLAHTGLVLVNLAFREQGLLVRKGNPLAVKDFNDLARPEVRFINRQRGAGTRLLTDMHLKRLGIDTATVNGYGREEYTHMNVASAVLSGNVDTGLAIRAAAVALDLDFIPVAEERYDLIIKKSMLDDVRVRTLLEIIRESKEFRETVSALGGYDLKESGNIMYEQ